MVRENFDGSSRKLARSKEESLISCTLLNPRSKYNPVSGPGDGVKEKKSDYTVVGVVTKKIK